MAKWLNGKMVRVLNGWRVSWFLVLDFWFLVLGSGVLPAG